MSKRLVQYFKNRSKTAELKLYERYLESINMDYDWLFIYFIYNIFVKMLDVGSNIKSVISIDEDTSETQR